MRYSMEEVVLSGLLHDIGKPAQRAFQRPEDLTGQSYDLESTLCPVKDGRYTHRHALFTEALFELMSRNGLRFPDSIDFGVVSKVASYHHRPDGCHESPAAAWICALSDRYSAGMDRRAEEEGERSRTDFRTTPLRCMFDELILDEKALGKPGRNVYKLDLLHPGDEANLIPIPWPENGKGNEFPMGYREIWEAFLNEFKALTSGKPLSFRLFEEALLGLLERTTWAIPSSTIDLPDISLYDHSRTTAAIAACLYRYHEARGEIDDVSSIKDGSRPKFRFVSGDLSGIQGTLFTLASQGVKGVNKILRARSFMLGAITESAALQLVEALGMPLCSVIQHAGGRFLILAPSLEGVEDIIEGLSTQWDQWLLDNYTGTLSLNMAISPPFSGDDFGAGRLGAIMASLGQSIEESKQRPLLHCAQGVLKREFPLDKACSTCGTRPAEITDEDAYRCPTCHKEVELGRRLAHADLVLWGGDVHARHRPVSVLGLGLALVDGELSPPFSGLCSVRKTRPFNTAIPWTIKYLANHVPVFTDRDDLDDRRYRGIESDDTAPGPGEPKTFAHIAAEALELDEDGAVHGRPYLGLLKADVDYLGFLFHYGLRRRHADEDRFTLSRLAQVSRMMDLYFTGYLKGLLHREFPATYTVYAGGDDLLLIGPWRQALQLARRINETFRAYTAFNPNITISAGLSLFKAHYPVNRAVREAEGFLEMAKEEERERESVRNRICALMDMPIPWARYSERLRDAEWFYEQVRDGQTVGAGFLYHIMSIVGDERSAADGDLRKANWRSRLAYHLARNIKGGSETDRKKKIVQWLEHLGLDDGLKFGGGPRDPLEWRLPLTIALYRGRR